MWNLKQTGHWIGQYTRSVCCWFKTRGPQWPLSRKLKRKTLISIGRMEWHETSGMKWVTEFPNVFRTAFMLITCQQLLLNLLFAGLYTKTLSTNISSFLNRSIVSLITFFVSRSLLKSATICNGYKEKNWLGITIMYY